jgi:uncharacterized protein (TIGR02444 family)
MINFKEDSFWSYSQIQYTQPDVEEYCLELQNTYRGNVNILLFCSWLGYCGIKISTKDVILAIRTIKDWDLNIVQSLRRARKYYTGSSVLIKNNNKIKSDLKKLELISEKSVQNTLCKWAVLQNFKPSIVKDLKWTITNINKYLVILDAPILSEKNKLFTHESCI